MVNIEVMVEDTIGLVHHIVRKHFPHFIGTDYYDDVVQEGIIGLLKAIEGFDESLGFEFSTYAYNVIRNAIRNNTYNLLAPAKVSRRSSSKYREYLELKETGLSLGDMAAVMGTKLSTLQSIINVYEYSSLDQSVFSDDEGNSIYLSELVASVEEEDLSNEIVICNTLIKLLPPKYEAVFVLYIEGFSQVEIGKRLGTSQVSVSRYLTKIKDKFLPLFRDYVNGELKYGELLLKLLPHNKNVGDYIKCYIDYGLELVARGHKAGNKLKCLLGTLDIIEIDKSLNLGYLAPLDLLKLVRFLDSNFCTDFIEVLVDEMVGVYEKGRFDNLLRYTEIGHEYNTA